MPTPLSVKWNGPTSAPAGAAYSGSVSCSGGAAPYSYRTDPANPLPYGLSLNPTSGQVTGTPDQPGNLAWKILVRDAAGATSSVSASLTVTAARAPGGETRGQTDADSRNPHAAGAVPAAEGLAAEWEGPTSGSVGEDYAGSISVTGGVKPYAFARENGALPKGLKLEAGSGKIAGTPREAGSFSYAVRVSDANDDVAVVQCPLSVDAG